MCYGEGVRERGRKHWYIVCRSTGGDVTRANFTGPEAAVEAGRRWQAASEEYRLSYENVRIYDPQENLVWDVLKDPEPVIGDHDETFVAEPPPLVRPNVPKPDNVELPQWAAVIALVATHPHHDHQVGTLRPDGLLPLWLDGRGEYHDQRWLIDPLGTPYDPARIEAEAKVVQEMDDELRRVQEREREAAEYKALSELPER